MEIKYHQHIGIYKNAVSDELCDSLINLYEKYPNVHEKRNRNQPERDNFLFIEKVLRKDIIPIPENEKNSIIKIVNSFNKSLKDTLDSYTYKYPHIDSYGKLIPDMGTKIQKTKPGEGYHSFHCEQHYDDLLLFSRVLVFTLYLNNVEEAGETEFLHQLIRVKPTKGTICLFPAGFTHPHRGNTPFLQEKYIATGWLCSEQILNLGNKLHKG